MIGIKMICRRRATLNISTPNRANANTISASASYASTAGEAYRAKYADKADYANQTALANEAITARNALYASEAGDVKGCSLIIPTYQTDSQQNNTQTSAIIPLSTVTIRIQKGTYTITDLPVNATAIMYNGNNEVQRITLTTQQWTFQIFDSTMQNNLPQGLVYFNTVRVLFQFDMLNPNTPKIYSSLNNLLHAKMGNIPTDDNTYTTQEKQKLNTLVGWPGYVSVQTGSPEIRDIDDSLMYLNLQWNHDYDIDMGELLGDFGPAEEEFLLALNMNTPDLTHRNEVKVSFDLIEGAEWYQQNFTHLSLDVLINNNSQALMTAETPEIVPGYHYTLLFTYEYNRVILDYKRYKLPE